MMICLIPKGSSQQVLLLDDICVSMLRDLCSPSNKFLLNLSSGIKGSATCSPFTYKVFPWRASKWADFPSQGQGRSTSVFCILSSNDWIKVKQPRLHTRGNNGEKSHLIKPLVLVPVLRASKYTHLTWASSAQSCEISQPGVSSWLMGDQIAWERQRLSSFSASEVGLETKWQHQVQLTTNETVPHVCVHKNK